RRYPVVFVTDAYWDFVKIDAIGGSLNYDKVAPEYITVGLGYAGENLDYGDLRLWELSPVPLGGGGADASGHASDFLRSIETEIIPFIEREYRVDSSHRVLAGSSLGGSFALYAMYTKPDLFSAYIAASPAVEIDHDWLFGYEDSFAKSGRPLHARLLVAVGGNEPPGHLASVKRFSERIVSRKSPGLAYSFHIVEGERHASMQYDAYLQGLIWAFAPIAPESGQSK
ncbi:MAG: alpha/beta hydrolase-fold protein, partial [Lacunisphaera sp.]